MHSRKVLVQWKTPVLTREIKALILNGGRYRKYRDKPTGRVLGIIGASAAISSFVLSNL